MRKTLFIAAALALLLPALPAGAALVYYPDPAYKRLNDDDPQPMEEMLELAGQGDARAQFILGDMYQKGKGGLNKDLKESRRWFEESAMHDYGQAFVRLAAQAKRAKNWTEAWQWYALAISALDGRERDFAIKAREDLVESAQLSRDDLTLARKGVSDWKDKRDQHLHDEKEKPENTAQHDQPEEKTNE